MIAKKALGFPLKGLRFAIKSGDTLVKAASVQVSRFKTRYDENKTKSALNEQPVAKRNYADVDQTEVSGKEASIDMREFEFTKAPINWIPATILVATPIAAAIITPWYLFTHEVSAPVWGVFGAFMVWTGISITAGYHRLLSHRAYKAHPVVKNFLLLGSTLAVQGSAFDWVSGHRTHHRHVDHRLDDPYSAKRGFWFSHMG